MLASPGTDFFKLELGFQLRIEDVKTWNFDQSDDHLTIVHMKITHEMLVTDMLIKFSLNRTHLKFSYLILSSVGKFSFCLNSYD